MKIKAVKLIAFTIILTMLLASCNTSKDDNGILAVIKRQPDSPYMRTFKDLNLGPLFDFHLQLPKADKSWVTIRVEGYGKGKELSSSPLINYSFGQSHEKEREGSMGLGIIKTQNNKVMLFSYALRTASGFHEVEEIMNEGASTWYYTIDDKDVKLKSGEEKVLAIYRQNKSNVIAGYDPLNEAELKKMIESDDVVLLLKMKVEEKEH